MELETSVRLSQALGGPLSNLTLNPATDQANSSQKRIELSTSDFVLSEGEPDNNRYVIFL